MVRDFSADNSLVSEWIRELRDITIQGDSMRFRKNMERIGEVAAYEISRMLPYKLVTIKTPITETTQNVLAQQPVLVTILRAGMPLYQGLLNFFDRADSAFIGAYRKHDQNGGFEINQQYVASPSVAGRPLIIADPMLATGASMVMALNALMEYDQPSQLHVVTAISSAAGIEYVMKHFPHANIWTGAVDSELTNLKYIVPGLGDAGDLAFGGKRQY